jgi:hypothetical protein
VASVIRRARRLASEAALAAGVGCILLTLVCAGLHAMLKGRAS